MSVIADLFSAAMYAFVLQNLIFTGGYGASEAVRMAAKPKQLFPLPCHTDSMHQVDLLPLAQ